MTAEISAHVLCVNFMKSAHKGNRKGCAKSLIFYLHIFPHFPTINLAVPLKIITFGTPLPVIFCGEWNPDATAIQEQEIVYTLINT